MALLMVVRLRLRRCSWPETMTVDDDHCLITEPGFPSAYNMSLGFPLLPRYASEQVSSLDSLCSSERNIPQVMQLSPIRDLCSKVGTSPEIEALEKLIIIQGAGNATYSCSNQLLERLLHYEMPPSTNP
ncbi:hypothetical protein Droror1_Dr00003505 [Drosera rotundifolia]